MVPMGVERMMFRTHKRKLAALGAACLLAATAASPGPLPARALAVPNTTASTIAGTSATTGPDAAAESAAGELHALTLFMGTDKGYDLYRGTTRAEGAVMLVRLLGLKSDAATGTAHPFTDVPAWASGSVSLLWQKGLTTGVSADRYGAAEPLSGRQYCTFLLRALQRADGAAAYRDAVATARTLRLIDANSLVLADPDAPVRRADLVVMSRNALAATVGSGSRTLLDNLVVARRVPADAAGRWLAARLAPSILGAAAGGYDQVRLLHDWLVNRNQYGWLPVSDDPNRTLSGEAYAALSLGTGVCGAYSRAMQYLCDVAGVPCAVVQGQASGTSGWTGHAWNQVRIDGAWYHLDVTFDDPIGTQTLRYNYFNVTDTDLARDHAWDRAAWPACTATAANWFVRNGSVVSSVSELEESLLAVVGRRGTELTVRAVPFSPGYSDATIRGILVDTGVVSGYTQSLDPVMGVIRVSKLTYFPDA